MSNIGLIIGRFQPFHNGHKLLIDTSLQENSSTLVLIGSSNIKNSDNPYEYSLRKKIIEDNYNNINILIGDLPDFPDDISWGNCILNHIPENTTTITLYFGDEASDSAIQSIKKMQDMFPCRIIFKEIPRSIIPISATQVRNAIRYDNFDILDTYLSDTTKGILKKGS